MNKEKIKILLVEDDPFLLNMYATKFEREGFSISVADDGEKAISLASGEAFDVIILDLIIPKKDGFEVLKYLKSGEKTKSIPVLLLTNLSQRDEVERGLALGAADYLVKAHFTPAEVVEKVKELIKK